MNHIYGLDIIRVSAAILVLLNHFAVYSIHAAAPSVVAEDRAFPLLWMFEGVGATGVQIFFVISGFVIAKSAEGQAGLPGAVRFGLARALRILPALWISGLISVCAMWLAGADLVPLLQRFARSAVLSPIGPYIDGVVWSLVVEAVFYALIALLILRATAIDLYRVAIVLGAMSALYIALFVAVTLAGQEAAQSLLGRFPFKVFLLRHGVFFAVGILIWHMLRPGAPETSAVRIRATLPVLLVFAGFGFGEIWLQTRDYGIGALASVLVWTAGVLGLLLSLRPWPAPRYPGMYQYLGGMSYTIYLNHYATGMAAVFLLSGAGLSGFALFAATLALVLLISHAVLSIEMRIRKAAKPLVGFVGRRVRPAA